MEWWGWFLIGLSVALVVSIVFNAWKTSQLNWFGVGGGLMHVFDTLLATFNGLAMRFMALFADLLEPRFLLALITVTGFFFVVWVVFDKMVDAPPIADLLAVLGLVLTPASTSLGFWFGREVGRRENRNPPSDS